MKLIKIKRVYEEPSDDDGYRLLVDRLWPRGVKKEKARLDEWNKNIAPSDQLRNWFGHKPERFKEFEKRYRVELSKLKEELKRIKAIANHSNLTLVYSAKDTEMNQAVVLLKILDRMK